MNDGLNQFGQDAHFTDRMLHALIGRWTSGISPYALALAGTDWLLHLTASPAKRHELADNIRNNSLRYSAWLAAMSGGGAPPPIIKPLPGDERFTATDWQVWPYYPVQQAFLLTEQWWRHATTDVRGMTPHHEDVVSFTARQLLDMVSPSNLPWMNPEVLNRTRKEGGLNLVRGFLNWQEDTMRQLAGQPPVGVEDFRVGHELAVTPGSVIHRNPLMELIQYAPTTGTVYREPVLICPSWIMKYYILDLRPENSLVRYLVERGHTVYMISWKNPGHGERHLGMEDYLRLGPLEAVDQVAAIHPEIPIHSVGYCLGGTLLSIAAATMARGGDQRLGSMTLLAAQVDFSEPGELDLFIDESQVTFLEDVMWADGYLDARKMAGAFQLLRSQDLFWSRLLHDYLLGERSPVFDLMAWNADTTRMPARMHSDYLRSLFLRNDLVEGRYEVDGQPVHLGDIKAPVFAVGTQKDHVAPWQSTYKVHRLLRTDVTFLLTSGGHNAGIVSPADHPRRTHQIIARKATDPWVPAERFAETAPVEAGSWWPVWERWLRDRSTSRRQPPPAIGVPGREPAELAPAPGTYVLES
ncbi:polyhydroxyalkanoate synthase [Natronocella acetinitrilica]|uniref:Polyhydroxyalkanoate synthase n=1 Tax=Natronocella acetinitrilica TaxID=414046 RepID=A0AAE3G247_9GAMM|nr:alpha/beta fold hydrolase [Natronocella acetinitrilica]MCP1673048.1 polyhydroxyalkanoate synthase [Natronocella acetinitrilica]